MRSDADIVAEMNRAKSDDIRFDGQDIRLRVESARGAVTLSGEVSRLAEKRWLGELATGVPGVVKVDNRLLVRPETDRSDREIAEAVTLSLMEDRAVDETEIKVAVREGVVTLRGLVPTVAKKKYVGVLVWWVPGVREVDNLLDLKWPEDDNDGEITEALVAVLDKDHLVDGTGVAVHTYQGVVTLRGSVFGEAARDAAENDAWYVLGVRDVKNQLRVSSVPPPWRFTTHS